MRPLAAVFVCPFKSALIAEVAGLRFVFPGLVVCSGPMTAVRTEVPDVAVVSTSIGFGHGVLCSFLKASGLHQSHG